MTTSLDQLPFDILFCIASNLHIEDLVHLSQTCRQLEALLDERTLCQRTVKVSGLDYTTMRLAVNGLCRSTIRTHKKHA
jgi:hypothetical protein